MFKFSRAYFSYFLKFTPFLLSEITNGFGKANVVRSERLCEGGLCFEDCVLQKLFLHLKGNVKINKSVLRLRQTAASENVGGRHIGHKDGDAPKESWTLWPFHFQ